MSFWLLGLLFQADRATIGPELNHTVTFWIADLVRENTGAVLESECVTKEIQFSVEDVVSENQGGTGVADEFFADQKCFSNAIRLCLFRVIDSDSELRAVPQIVAEHGAI